MRAVTLVPIVSALLIMALIGCGDGNGGPTSGSQLPTGQLAINTSNAQASVATATWMSGSLVKISLIALENLTDLKDSSLLQVPLTCGYGSATATLNDNDSNGSISDGDRVTIDYANCFQRTIDNAVSGQLDLDVSSWTLLTDQVTSSNLEISILASLQIEAESGAIVDVSGTFDIFSTIVPSYSNLLITGSSSQPISFRTGMPSIEVTEVADSVLIARIVDESDRYSIDYSLSINSQLMGGAYACTTPTPLAGLFREYPDIGVLKCTGNRNSSARIVTTGPNDVDVEVDSEGDGTFVNAGLVVDGAGSWEDYIEGPIISERVHVPSSQYGPVIPPLSSTLLSIDVSDIAVSKVNGQVYVSNDLGISEIDSSTLVVGRSLAMAKPPGPLAISDDGSTLWIGLRDASELISVDVATFAARPPTPLGLTPNTLGERAIRAIRVAPGTTDTVVVSNASVREMKAFKAGVPLPNLVTGVDAPLDFEFGGSTSIIGIDGARANPPAILVTLNANGLVTEKVLSDYGGSSGWQLSLGHEGAFLNNGRVFNIDDEVVVGRIDLGQTGSRVFRNAVYADEQSGVAYFYDAFEDTLDFYSTDSLIWLGEYLLQTNGNVINIFEATNDRLLLALDSELHLIDKSALIPNKLSDKCSTIDLRGRLDLGFYLQSNCRFNDAIYDTSRNLIYASLPSAAGPAGNSIAVIDPTTAMIQDRLFVGSEPTRLAIAPSGNRLYVTSGQATSIFAIDLQTMRLLSPIRIVDNPAYGGLELASEVAVSPASDTDVIAATSHGVSLYSSGNQATNKLPSLGPMPELFFGESESRVYAVSHSDRITTIDVNSTGIFHVRLDTDKLKSGGVRQKGNFLYDRRGVVYDPAALNTVGDCQIGRSSAVSPDPSSDLVYYLDVLFDNALLVCDTATFTAGTTVPLPLFGGQMGVVRSMFLAGSDRLVITGTDRMIFLDPAEL